ncbi:hypothetical protein EDB80DRAFT_308580 [Ilyonectria destructans]|nr:hypothetical protein EDB80DRAFT_308580 [Ilyonectria destructans]
MSAGAPGTKKNSYYPVVHLPELFPQQAVRNNSQGLYVDKEALERFKIRELCEGWGVYRDAAEWAEYRSMFFDDAYIVTSWKQGSIDQFIAASVSGEAKGHSFMYILHRINGHSVDLNPGLVRAGCKMKATITARFTFDGIEMDLDADCRFYYFLEKRDGRWGVVHFTLLFDKDRFHPVNPSRVYEIPEEEVEGYPSGYKYLAWAEAKIGHPPKLDLDSHGPEKEVLLAKYQQWLDGKDISLKD